MSELGVYTYVLNGVKYDMPFMEMIQSVLPVADEVHIVTDKRFNDGTIEKLQTIDNDKVKIHVETIDLDNPAVDGATKQIAREKCTAPILMQMDSDEVARPEDINKINYLKENWPTQYDVIGTGVINWFNGNHIKLSSAGSAKERFTRSAGDIYHGIPTHLRIAVAGTQYYYAQPESTDGAGLIDNTGNPLVPQLILAENNIIKDAANPNSIWLHHYSWYSLPRKWEMKQTWHYFWGLLFGKIKNLDDYTRDLDGEPVNFWGQHIQKPNDSYIQPIKDEMQDKSIVGASMINHPPIMKDWLSRQRIYIPRRWPLKDININMDNKPYRFDKV